MSLATETMIGAELIKIAKMDNMDKVAKGLKLCVVTGDLCGECPYDGMESCIEKLHDDALALLKEQEETKTIICQRCGDEIEIKWSLLRKPDMEAIAKRDAFLSDKNGKKLNNAMQSL